MTELIQEYQRSQQLLYTRIRELESEMRGANPSTKHDLNQRVIKLRGMHLELARDIEDMEKREKVRASGE